MAKWIFAFITYFAIAAWTAGAMNATERVSWRNYPNLCRDNQFYVAHSYRDGVVFSVLTGLLPPGWLAAILITGAYQDGWTVKTGIPCNANGML